MFDVVADLVGVGFEPGRSEVRIRLNGAPMAFPATDEQVERAIALRGGQVRVVGIRGAGRNRLLGLFGASEETVVLRGKAAEDLVFERWNGLLRMLAK